MYILARWTSRGARSSRDLTPGASPARRGGRRCVAPRWASGEAAIDGIAQVLLAGIIPEIKAGLVGGVGKADPRCWVREAERAASAGGAKGLLVEAKLKIGKRFGVAQGEDGLYAEHYVEETITWWGGGLLERVEGFFAKAQLDATGGEFTVGSGHVAHQSNTAGRGQLQALHAAIVVPGRLANDLGVGEGAEGDGERIEEAHHKGARHLVHVEEQLPLLIGVYAGYPRLGDFSGQANVELDIQRAGDLILKEATDGAMLGICTPHQLALVPAERYAVVAMTGAGFPDGFLPGHGRGDQIGVGQLFQV